MYYSDFNGSQMDKMWKTADPTFPGLEFLRVHAGLSSLAIPAGTTPLVLPLPTREQRDTHLSPTKGSPPIHLSSPRPGSATATSHPHLSPLTHSSGLNFLQTSKPGVQKPALYSPPPLTSNNPEHNVCKLIEFRGSQIAAFSVDNRELICLPQAFELFLKHLVGGLHTVYTKLKRLEIMPVVCNVEQVRILRGLGAIQPGVNRCKLISCAEFDTLYDDCTNSNSRPGRPAKRVQCPSPMEADAMENLKRRKLEASRDYPYNQQFIDHKPLLNGFSAMGMEYTPMHHFSNFFSMHHPLFQPMAMASQFELKPHEGSSKPETAAQASGVDSPTPRDERLHLLDLSERASSLNAGVLRCLSKPGTGFEDKPLNLQTGDGHNDNQLDESRSDDSCLVGDELGPKNRRQEDDIDEACSSDDSIRTSMEDKTQPADTAHVFAPINREPQFSDFESLVSKFNGVVRALIDAAKTAGRRFGEERKQIIQHLVREKERCMELEEEMKEERKKREFFQRRAGRLKRALRSETTKVTGCPSAPDYSPEVFVVISPDGSPTETPASREDHLQGSHSPSRAPPSPVRIPFHSV